MPLGPNLAPPQMSPGTWLAFNRYLYVSFKQNSGERFRASWPTCLKFLSSFPQTYSVLHGIWIFFIISSSIQPPPFMVYGNFFHRFIKHTVPFMVFQKFLQACSPAPPPPLCDLSKFPFSLLKVNNPILQGNGNRCFCFVLLQTSQITPFLNLILFSSLFF